MTLDVQAAEYALSGLRPFPTAVTTIHDGRTNGMMALSAGTGSVVPEAPRATIGIQKFNFSHDLIQASGVFVIHLLGNGELLESSLQIIQALGGSSGRDGDKLAGLATKVGVGPTSGCCTCSGHRQHRRAEGSRRGRSTARTAPSR